MHLMGYVEGFRKISPLPGLYVWLCCVGGIDRIRATMWHFYPM